MDIYMIIDKMIRSVLILICYLFLYYCLVRIFIRMGFSRSLVIILTILFPLSLIYLSYAKWPFPEYKRWSNQIEIVNADFLKKNRKYAIPFIFFLAAIATPPDQ